MISGPIEGEMFEEATGKMFPVEVYQCDECEHVVQMIDLAGRKMVLPDLAEPPTCIQGCRDCSCNKLN